MIRRALLLLPLTACATHLPVRPDLPAGGAKVPMRVAVVIPYQLAENVDDLGKFDEISGSFKVDTGQRILPAVKSVLGGIFDSVEQVPDVNHAKLADVVCVIKQMRLFHPSMRPSDYEMRFDLRVQCSKVASGDQVIDASYAEFLKAVRGKQPVEGVQTPIEQTMSATLEKLAVDLRAAFGAPAAAPAAPAAAVAAAAPPAGTAAAPAPGAAPAPAPGQPDQFSDFPPPPPPPGSTATAAEPAKTEPAKTEPPPAQTAAAATPAPEPAPAAASAAAAAAPPPPTPAPEPAPVAIATAKPAPPPAAKRGPNIPLMAGGALLFLGGYLTPPIVMNALNLPGGTSNHAWVPFAGPLLAATQNPFLSQDQSTMILAIASTAAQGLGLIVAVVGAVMGGSSGGGAKTASLVVEGEGWALVPSISPAGVSVTLLH